MRSLSVPGSVLAGIRDEAEAGYPDEACGFLLGRLGAEEGEVLVARPATNVRRGEDRRRRYLIEPGTYRRVEREADADGREVVGFWHSHPDHPARPSAHDLEHAWPSLAYVIVPVAAGRAGEPAAWTLAEDRSGFEPVDLDIIES